MADTFAPEQLKVDNFHHSQWPFPFSPIVFLDYIRSRNFSEKNDKPLKNGVEAIQDDVIAYEKNCPRRKPSDSFQDHCGVCTEA